MAYPQSVPPGGVNGPRACGRSCIVSIGDRRRSKNDGHIGNWNMNKLSGSRFSAKWDARYSRNVVAANLELHHGLTVLTSLPSLLLCESEGIFKWVLMGIVSVM